MTATYGTYTCGRCVDGLECGDSCPGVEGFAELLAPLWDDFQVLCPCCGQPAELQRVLEERPT